MDRPSWQSTVIGVAFVGLVGVMFWRATDNDFTTIWQGAGTVVGVVTGAIPAYFFATQANARADSAAKRAEAYALMGTPEQAQVDAPQAPPKNPAPILVIGATLVALALAALVAYLVKLSTDHDFTTIWTGVGSVVGLLAGAIPGLVVVRRANDRASQSAQAALAVAQRLPANGASDVADLMQKLAWN
jgi:uncharacterized membrane protein YbhN (UPF0104 family)